VHYHEVLDLSDIPTRLTSVMNNLEMERQRARQNAPLVRELVHPTRTVDGWLAIFDELCGTTDRGLPS
jgi:hypothetical protein